jgi:cytoskeletal protein RodZ
MTRRRGLIFAAIVAVVALDVALWLRLFTPEEVTDNASAASREKSTAAQATPSEPTPTEPSSSQPPPTTDDPTTVPGTEPEQEGANTDQSERIDLSSYTQTVGLLETATLSGRYSDAPDGVPLYVQRLGSDGWVTFPLPTAVSPSGRFRALAQLGQPGPNRLRIVDPTTQTTSDVVSITVR